MSASYNLGQTSPLKDKYLRMINGMIAAGPTEWSVYILRCGDGSLYTGIAKNVENRLAAHSAGKGAAYTRTRRPLSVVFREDGLTRSQALIREAAIKRLPKAGKEKLVGA